MAESRVRQCVLGLFAKWPEPGKVKTRLAEETSPEWAARVADAFLRDCIARFAELPYLRHLVFDPPEAEADFASLAQERWRLTPQATGDLGQRMSAFIHDQLTDGADAIVLLGTDAPTVPLAFVEHAFEQLRQADVVLGPACDGGYYLLGCAGKCPPIFSGVDWGTPTVLAQTVARLAQPDWKVRGLTPWYDVDTLADWRFLQGHVPLLQASGIDSHIPWTEALLREPVSSSAQPGRAPS